MFAASFGHTGFCDQPHSVIFYRRHGRHEEEG